MPVVVEQYVEHFDRNFDEIKDALYDQMPKEFSSFMKQENTSKPFLKRSYIGGLGMPQQNRDMEPIPFVTAPKGPIAHFVPINYRLGYQIERQTVEQEEWGLLANRPQSMLYGSSVLMDITATNILNNGKVLQAYDFDPGATAKPLFATDHTREDKLGTWSNLINQDLPITTETVFQAIVSLLYNMEDTNGLPVYFNDTVNIYVPTNNPTLWQQAVEVANSVMNPNTSDNKINAAVKQFQFNVVPLRHLTNPNTWFIGWQPSKPLYGLLMVVNIEADISPLQPFGGNPDAWYSRLRSRFVAGYESKRGIAAIGA